MQRCIIVTLQRIKDKGKNHKSSQKNRIPIEGTKVRVIDGFSIETMEV